MYLAWHNDPSQDPQNRLLAYLESNRRPNEPLSEEDVQESRSGGAETTPTRASTSGGSGHQGGTHPPSPRQRKARSARSSAAASQSLSVDKQVSDAVEATSKRCKHRKGVGTRATSLVTGKSAANADPCGSQHMGEGEDSSDSFISVDDEDDPGPSRTAHQAAQQHCNDVEYVEPQVSQW